MVSKILPVLPVSKLLVGPYALEYHHQIRPIFYCVLVLKLIVLYLLSALAGATLETKGMFKQHLTICLLSTRF